MEQLAAKPYAKALFELSLEKNRLDEYMKCAKSFLKISENNKEYNDMIKHPCISSTEKMKLIKNVFSQQLPEDFFGLISVVFLKKRESILNYIMDEFIVLAKKHKNILEAEVTSAVQLTDEELSKINAILSRKLNKQVVIKTVVDKNVIAGFKIKAGGLLYDATAASQLLELKRQLLDKQLV